MRTATIFAAAAAILPAVFAQSSVSVTGVKDGRIGVRRDITELARDSDSWNLYLLAMSKYMSSDTNNILSYHQISGIHGLPCQDYSGVGSNQAALNQGGCGYCTHSTPLFAPWHRAYTALYEQGLLAQVQNVINDFSGDQKAKFQAAASGFRAPYWDWAAGSGGVPSFLTAQTVSVPSPSGGSQTIANPLYSYKYQVFNSATTGGTPWSNWATTLRYPTSDASNAVSDTGSMVSDINGQFRNTQSLVYKMLLNCKTFSQMADDSASTSNSDCAASLESIHGIIHVAIGGKGHMSYLEQAGFDPTFFLHHVNVDRLLSLWQIAQDKQWYSGGVTGYPTWTHTSGQPADGNFPLTPFYKDAGSRTFWTPNGLADWTTLGYTYPELGAGLSTSKSDIISKINTLYGTNAVTPPPPSASSSASPSASPSSTRGSGGASASSAAPAQSSHAAPPFPGGNGSFPLPSISIPSIPSIPGVSSLPDLDLPSYLPDLLTPLGRKWEWAANIVAERMGLGGSFSVYVFMGPTPTDSSTWGSAKNLVGVWSVFASKSHTATSGHLVSGSVSLTATLVEQIMAGNLKGLLGFLVEPFLQKQLTWAVKTCDGTVVPNDQVPGLQVQVVSSKVKPPTSLGAAPEFEEAEPYNNITSGDAGGSQGGISYGGGWSSPASGSFGTGSGGYGSDSDAGSWTTGGLAAPTCIPQVKYVTEYVTV